ncbi:MAG: methyltransferase domain-containing protein [Solirubrobacterales bacterium]
MILEQFFAYYLEYTSPAVRDRILGTLPAGVSRDAKGMAGMFGRNDAEALDFLLRFHNELNDIRENDLYNCIVFDLADNVCFPFFIDYVLNQVPAEARGRFEADFGTKDLDEIVKLMRENRDRRNQFRKQIASLLTQEDLFTLNEVIALQNFSSGGEYSFLNLAYPDIKDIRGKVLDAGCGAGFASLVMSQSLNVTGVDACLPRVNRAQGLADLLKAGQRDFFARMLKLIEVEMGTLACEVHFPQVDELLTRDAGQVSFNQCALDSITFADSSFDAIFCMDVLEHTYDPAVIIKQFGRVAKPGARIYITAPNAAGEIHQKYAEDDYGAAFPALLHMHHFEAEALNAMFAAAGCEPVKIELFDPISRAEFETMVKDDDREGKAILARSQNEIPRQIFAVYRKN